MNVSRENYKFLTEKLPSILEEVKKLNSPDILILAGLVNNAADMISAYDISAGSTLKNDANRLLNVQNLDPKEYQNIFENGFVSLRIKTVDFIRKLRVPE